VIRSIVAQPPAAMMAKNVNLQKSQEDVYRARVLVSGV
jgi:hypothetical protein